LKKEKRYKQKGFVIYSIKITENFPNLEKVMPFKYRKLPGHQKDLSKRELPHDILSLKQQAQRLEKEY
jgi:hypothetical protein